MDTYILQGWDENNHQLKQWLKITPMNTHSYLSLLTKTIEVCFPRIEGEYENGLDPSRITQVDYGEYQGTLVFIIGSFGYQPSEGSHWYTAVDYGSCSGCDTLEAINGYSDELPTENQVTEYWTLCLHMVQKLRRMYGDRKK